MEPRLENVPSLVLSATPPSRPREEAGVRFSATIPSGSELQPPHKDPSGSKPQGRAATVSRVATKPLAGLTRIWTDFRQFYSFRRQSALLILVGVAVLLLAVSLLGRLRRDAGDVVVHPVNALAEGGANAGGPGLASGVAASVNGTSSRYYQRSFRCSPQGSAGKELCVQVHGTGSKTIVKEVGADSFEVSVAVVFDSCGECAYSTCDRDGYIRGLGPIRSR